MKNYNSFTGTLMKEKSGDTLNPLTGQYRSKDDESTGKRWPSITDIDKRVDAQQSESERTSVSKSTDENPWPSLSNHFADDNDNISKEQNSISMDVPFFAVIEKAADEHIVYGIVYEPDTEDAQGDQANAAEIKKAAYGFMENNPVFKIMHKGKSVKVKILESYIAPTSFTIEKRKVKKGSWILVTRINDKGLWKDIKSGKFTGYSMAGTARSS